MRVRRDPRRPRPPLQRHRGVVSSEGVGVRRRARVVAAARSAFVVGRVVVAVAHSASSGACGGGGALVVVVVVVVARGRVHRASRTRETPPPPPLSRHATSCHIMPRHASSCHIMRHEGRDAATARPPLPPPPRPHRGAAHDGRRGEGISSLLIGGLGSLLMQSLPSRHSFLCMHDVWFLVATRAVDLRRLESHTQ